MKKKNIKYVFIPAFAATALFPFLTNENEVFASNNSTELSSHINNKTQLSISESFDNSITKISASSDSASDSGSDIAEVKPIPLLETENKIKYENAVPSIAPVASVPNPFTGKIDGLSNNGNKVIIDKNGNVSEFNTPSEAPVSEDLKPFTGKVYGLSENRNKVNIDNQGNIIEHKTTEDAPTTLELPHLNINNNTTTITIKSNDKSISVEFGNNDARNLEFKTKDITNTIDLEDLKDKILADKNNIIKNKDEITSVRVIDLELQKNSEEVKLNIPRTVHIGLLQNEKDKDILVYHIKDDNTIELIPSNITADSLSFTVNHFSKFTLITKIKTALASSEKDINSSSVQEEKKFTIIETRGAKSTPLNPPKTLPKTGATTNNFLTALGFSLLALTALLKRKKNN